VRNLSTSVETYYYSFIGTNDVDTQSSTGKGPRCTSPTRPSARHRRLVCAPSASCFGSLSIWIIRTMPQYSLLFLYLTFRYPRLNEAYRACQTLVRDGLFIYPIDATNLTDPYPSYHSPLPQPTPPTPNTSS
jgi:hypothetical protein